MQITVDNFNRHYVYRHDLTQDIINDSFKELCQLKDNGMEDSMVLDYHLLLLEHLRGAQTGSSDEQDVQDLWKRVRSLRQKSSSAFYTIKLYFLEFTILARLHLWKEANKCLSQTICLGSTHCDGGGASPRRQTAQGHTEVTFLLPPFLNLRNG